MKAPRGLLVFSAILGSTVGSAIAVALPTIFDLQARLL